MWHSTILDTIGNTPLVRINGLARDLACTVLAKMEYFNPGGSVKDRIGIAMVAAAEAEGKLAPGGTIVECTSGNTGAGLALAAIARGYRCVFTTTDKQSREKINVLRALGAEVVVCPTNVAPDDPRSYYSVAARIAAETPNAYFPNQYEHPANAQAHYDTTGPELWAQTDGRITHFIAGAGTGGTISGTARFLKEKNPSIKVIGVDPYGSVYHSYWHTREFDETEIYPYVTEGVGEDILAGNMDFDIVDDFVRVSDAESLRMARRLSREEGLFVGGSCGLAMAGALQWLREHAADIGPEDVAVVLMPDSGFRYLSKLYDDSWMRDHGFLAPELGLTAGDILDARGALTGAVLAVGPDETLARAITTMAERGISQMPVADEGAIVGSLTETGILQLLIERPSATDLPVREAMGPPFPVVDRTLPVEQLSTYLEQGQNALLVRSSSEDRYQIITKSDLIRALASHTRQ